MTVKELIELLETVEDKDTDILIEVDDESMTEFELIEDCRKYYGKFEGANFVYRTRKCHILG